MELGSLLDLANRFNVFLLAALTFFVWRIYTNHLPHIEAAQEKLHEKIEASAKEVDDRLERLYVATQNEHKYYERRIARLEGRDSGLEYKE